MPDLWQKKRLLWELSVEMVPNQCKKSDEKSLPAAARFLPSCCVEISSQSDVLLQHWLPTKGFGICRFWIPLTMDPANHWFWGCFIWFVSLPNNCGGTDFALRIGMMTNGIRDTVFDMVSCRILGALKVICSIFVFIEKHLEMNRLGIGEQLMNLHVGLCFSAGQHVIVGMRPLATCRFWCCR